MLENWESLLLDATYAVRLPWELAAVIVLAFVSLYVLHWFRKAFREGAPEEPLRGIEIPGDRIKAYDTVQRRVDFPTEVSPSMI